MRATDSTFYDEEMRILLNIEEDPYQQAELDAWAEVSARMGSRVLRGFYIEGYGERIVITRTVLPDGGCEFDIEPFVAPEPKRSWRQRVAHWLEMVFG